MDKSELKAKLDNYWYYYKVHTIVAVLAVIVLIFTISDAVNHKAPILNVILTGSSISEEKLASLEDQATGKLAKGNKQEVVLDFLAFDKNSDSQGNIAVVEKIMAMIQARDLDVIITDRDSFDSYAQQGAFLRLDEGNAAPDLSSAAAKFVLSRVKDTDDTDHPYGIDISNNQVLKDAGYDTDGKVLGILANTQRLSLTLQLLKSVLKI